MRHVASERGGGQEEVARGGGNRTCAYEDLVPGHAYIPSNRHVHMPRCQATAAACMLDTSSVARTLAHKYGGTALDASQDEMPHKTRCLTTAAPCQASRKESVTAKKERWCVRKKEACGASERPLFALSHRATRA